MKFTTEDYDKLRGATLRHMAYVDTLTYPDNVTDERRRWDAFWMAIDSNRTVTYQDFREYNDDHIDTALRRIQAEARKDQT